MGNTSRKPDVGAVVNDPWDFFASPMDVVNDVRFTQEEKQKILESWALDAQLLSQAEAENMPGKERPRLQEVKLALLELQK
jgi:hypothetical protein